MRTRSRFLFSGVLLLALTMSLFHPALDVTATGLWQDDTPQARAQALLERLTPEERVGQLFLVTFVGTSVDENSQIYDLIVRHHVGGVVLLAGNDNFVAAPETVPEAYRLLSDLQTAEWQGSQQPFVDPVTGGQVQGTYIPLFIGISQEGDGYPTDQILSGLTPLPNQMAIGATWQPSLAEQTGAIAGQELSALGFNLYFGPSLDVLESPNPAMGGGLGVRVFGGDPYWVGEMGKAYITGLHSGSNGKMVIVAKHFPGRGGSDRPAGEEVGTVRKSLEQLKQIELAPFFAVTSAPDPLAVADGLMVSHIRYQGFQGNIRAITRPVSFDQQALSQILALPAFASWRGNGGLIVSDDLGSQAVRRFYDPSGGSFSARSVAREAFLAGNDLLYLGNIVANDAPDTYTTVLRVLDFFTQKYKEDPAFAQRVDDAVLRILTVKYRLYGVFSHSAVIPPPEGLDSIGDSEAVTFSVALQSSTLINPDVLELDAVLSEPPNVRDRLLFITDTRSGHQCSTCPEQALLPVDAFQNAVRRLYGPQAGGQVDPQRLTSYTFDDLAMILEGGGGHPALEISLRNTNWVVISMLDADPNQPRSTVLRRFLSERQDLLRDKRVILFAFNAPYYLDATDISKLTAYYGLYSKSPPFIKVAAGLLFQELSPEGSLPVSVPAIGYDLLSATTPDPNQVIELYLDLPPAPTPEATLTPEPTPTPIFRVGDTVSVRTGVILDHNQHPVPDGTGVRFTVLLGGEGGTLQQVDAVTVQGVARASFHVDKPGLLEIRAVSEPAITSVVLQLNVTDEGVSVTILPPSPTLETVTPTPIFPPLGGTDSGVTPFARGRPGFGSWLLVVLMLAGGSLLAYRLGLHYLSARWGLRWALGVVLGGLAAYNYLAVGLPGSASCIVKYGIYGILGVVVLGTGMGWAGVWIWARLVSAQK